MQTACADRRQPALWLVPVLLGLIGGTALQVQQRALAPVLVYAALAVAGGALALLLTWRGRPTLAGYCAMGLALAMLAFGQVGLRALWFQSQALDSALEGRDLQMTGVVAAMPQVTPAGVRFVVEVEQARMEGAPARLPPRVQLSWYARAPGEDSVWATAPGRAADPAAEPPDGPARAPHALAAAMRAGERWRWTVRLKAPHGSSNPFGFDYELWLWEHGLQANGYVRDAPPIVAPERIGQSWQHPVEWLRQRVRDRIQERLADARAAGWISALVTGDQNAIERGDWDIFRATGVAHLMSISGLHVTMFAWLAARLAGALWRRCPRCCLHFAAPQLGLMAGALAACCYALFSGWGVPAQRTVWMLAVVCVLRLSGRCWPWPLVWLLAAALVLVLDPWALLQPGFWLSFVAVGVLFASSDPDAVHPPPGLRARALALLREQMVLTLALTPLVLLLFGQVSLVGLVANLVAIPWVTLLVTPLAMAGTLWSALWDLAALAVAALALLLEALAALRFASVSVPIAPGWLGAAGVVGGILLALRWPPPLRLAGAALVLPVLLWQPPRPPPGQFELLAADVGQGNAVLVRTAGHALLYDSGPRYSRDSDAGSRVLVPLLRALGERLDMLLLSHGDTDHVGGAPAVLAMQPQTALRSSLEPEHSLNQLRTGTRCSAGQRWRWDGVDFAILHPQAQDYAGSPRPNALSCVLRISTPGSPTRPGTAALLTGDIEAAQEARLVADAAPLAAHLLLVPHHGSRTSSSAVFLDAVAPRQALVQSGYRNRFGHPAAAPLERLRARAVVVHDSPHCGALRWRSDAPADWVCQRAQALRYWHHIAPP